RVPWGSRDTYLMRSAGPDKRFDTADDLLVYLEVKTGAVAEVVTVAMGGGVGGGVGGGIFGFSAGLGGVLGGVPANGPGARTEFAQFAQLQQFAHMSAAPVAMLSVNGVARDAKDAAA